MELAKINIIGLGPGSIGDLTLEAVDKIKNGDKLFLRTERHPTIEYLRNNSIDYECYDHVYDETEKFSQVYEKISEDLLQKAKKYGIINYCVPGHPLVAEKTVNLLIEKQNQGKIELEIISGLSFIEPVINSLQIDLIEGLKIIDGLDIFSQKVDINTDNLITQVYNNIRASELKLELMDIYGDEYEVYVIKSAGIKEEETKIKVPLYEIDRIEWIDHLTSIYIPKMKQESKARYDIQDLIRIMKILRGEDGCSWDAEQTHESLRPYVIEEAYEVVDAIDNDDIDGLVEELGDLLLQVIFHSEIGSDEGYFNFTDITTEICEKLIRRHPHIFESHNLTEQLQSWNDIKAKEKNMSSYTERLKSIPKGLSALMKSYKVQKRASDVGFDWDNISGALEKLYEELEEVKQELDTNDHNRLEEEIGDFIFSIVNVCRFVDVNPEVALNRTINKFIDRFEFIECEGKKKGKDIKNMTLSEMDMSWNDAKKNIKKD